MKSNTLKLKNKNIYILSPHLDDAVLSCGQFMLNNVKSNKITIINCFTKAHNGPYTLSAKKYLESCMKGSNGPELFNARIQEDKTALQELGVKVINIGLADALFRRKEKRTFLGKFIPELDHVYPTFRWHIISGRISKQDTHTLILLKKKLSSLIEDSKNTVILVPLGIGNHVDHRLIYTASSVLEKNNILYYSDFPYNLHQSELTYETDFRVAVKVASSRSKRALIEAYESQIMNLFPNGKIPMYHETFFKIK